MSLQKRIANNIQKLRKVSLAKLAEKAGIPNPTLQKILYNKNVKDIGISTANKIAKALNVSIDDLMK